MWRSHVRDAAHRAYMVLTRGTLKKTDDKKFWQYSDIDLFSGETIKNVERIQQYGYTAHPLPEKDAKGKALKYREWDVNSLKKGVNRGPERLVTGSDGSAYYTDDHYKSFKKIR